MGSFAPTLAQAVCRHGALRIQGWPPCQAMQRRQRKVTGTRHEFDAPACASLYWRRSGFASRPPGFPVVWSACCCSTGSPHCRQARTGAVRESPGGRRLPYRFRATQGIQCGHAQCATHQPHSPVSCRSHAAGSPAPQWPVATVHHTPARPKWNCPRNCRHGAGFSGICTPPGLHIRHTTELPRQRSPRLRRTGLPSGNCLHGSGRRSPALKCQSGDLPELKEPHRPLPRFLDGSWPAGCLAL